MDISFDWGSVGTFLGGLLSGGGIWKVTLDLLSRYDSLKSKKSLSDIAGVYDAMQDMLYNTSIKRVLVLSTHNDGLEIKPGSKLYTSVLYELVQEPFLSMKLKYQNIPLDAAYVQMLVQVLANGKVAANVANMKPGLLKDIYQIEGVGYSEIYYLADSKRKKIWYMSIASEQDISNFTPGENLTISTRVDQIQKLMKRHA
jgi:hypothetical protein